MSRPSDTFATHSSMRRSVGRRPSSLGYPRPMRFGLALPQYDYSVQSEHPLQFATIVEHARRAAAAGFESVWLSDHLYLDIGKYGGSSDREACYDPIVTLAALARLVPDVRLGTLVFCEALRPAAVLAKALATLDRIS